MMMTENVIIDKKYCITSYLGKGEFGYVYKATHIRTQEPVAIKSEPAMNKTNLLKNEATIYHYLVKEPGFPKVKYYGLYNDRYYMAIDLLGPSLTTFMRDKSELSLDQIKIYGAQMIDRIETVHKKGLIHRDIKPDNFLFGLPPKNDMIHLIDFGFCKKYINNQGLHIPYREKRTPLGTPLFMSLHVVQGKEPSRRDDLESMFYCLLYLYNPREFVENKQKIETMEIPTSWKRMFETIRGYAYDQTPDYKYLKLLL